MTNTPNGRRRRPRSIARLVERSSSHTATTRASMNPTSSPTANSKKFGGDLYDILDAKIKIFRDLCNKAGVPPNLYHDAYSTMLKDRAEQFYYDHLAERNLRFDEMVRQTKEFFHTVENRQLYLQ